MRAIAPAISNQARRFLNRKLVMGLGLVELFMLALVLGLIASIMIAGIGQIRCRARVVSCMSNTREIASMMNLYKAQFLCYPRQPIDDFSDLRDFCSDVSVFACPGTQEGLTDEGDLYGGTSYFYFGTVRDLERLGYTAQKTSDVFNPFDPGASWEPGRKYGAVYDAHPSNHCDNCINIIYLEDNRCERICNVDVSCSCDRLAGAVERAFAASATAIEASKLIKDDESADNGVDAAYAAAGACRHLATVLRNLSRCTEKQDVPLTHNVLKHLSQDALLVLKDALTAANDAALAANAWNWGRAKGKVHKAGEEAHHAGLKGAHGHKKVIQAKICSAP